jgi:hypothetical protein
MIDHPVPGNGEVAQRISRHARTSARNAVLRVARATGAPVISRPVWPGTFGVPDYAEPSSGLRIARALETAATGVTREYVRYAREAGLRWDEIGAELGLGSDSPDHGASVGDAAVNFAAGAGGYGVMRLAAPTFSWTCPVCQNPIQDHGPSAGTPPEQERGHAADCRRMADEIAAWNTGQRGAN